MGARLNGVRGWFPATVRNVFDVIVVGLGAMGSAAAAQLAARGQRVLGLEQFDLLHEKGSSHGASRVIRLAYFEHPSYVPLLLRAYELWNQLEQDTGRSLLTMTGGLMIGRPQSEVVSGSQRSARTHGLRHEMLDAAEIRRRFPPFTPPDGDVALYEARAGVLRAEESLEALQQQAIAHGAELRSNGRVLGWLAKPGGEGIDMETDAGSVEARHLVLTPGPWASSLFELPQLPLTVERQVLFWFAPVGGAAAFSPARFPIYIWDVGDRTQFYRMDMTIIEFLAAPFVASTSSWPGFTPTLAFTSSSVASSSSICRSRRLPRWARPSRCCCRGPDGDPHAPFVYWISLAFTFIGAAIFSTIRVRHAGRIPQEAIIGICYAVASAAAILAMSKATSESEHLRDMLVGNILAVTWPRSSRRRCCMARSDCSTTGFANLPGHLEQPERAGSQGECQAVGLSVLRLVRFRRDIVGCHRRSAPGVLLPDRAVGRGDAVRREHRPRDWQSAGRWAPLIGPRRMAVIAARPADRRDHRVTFGLMLIVMALVRALVPRPVGKAILDTFARPLL